MRTHEGMTHESLALCWLVPSLGEKRMERVTKLMNKALVGLPVDLDDDDKSMASNFTVVSNTKFLEQKEKNSHRKCLHVLSMQFYQGGMSR